ARALVVAIADREEQAVGRVAAHRVADQSHRRAIPARADGDPLGAAVKVVVPKGEGLDPRIVCGRRYRVANRCDVRFVEYLVTFEVERPFVAAAEVRDHLLLAIHETAVGHGLVPLGRHDADARIADRLDRLARAVVAVAERDHVLVDQGQGRTDALDEGITEADAVAQEGEGADPGPAAGRGRFSHRRVRRRRRRAIRATHRAWSPAGPPASRRAA